MITPEEKLIAAKLKYRKKFATDAPIKRVTPKSGLLKEIEARQKEEADAARNVVELKR